MPTYEYVCESCGNEWEAEQSIKADPLKDCPKCAQQTAKRQISRGTGFILKGGGWYSDLYSGASNSKSESKSSESKPSESKSSESKSSESKGSSDSGSSGSSSSGSSSSGSSSGGSSSSSGASTSGGSSASAHS